MDDNGKVEEYWDRYDRAGDWNIELSPECNVKPIEIVHAHEPLAKSEFKYNVKDLANKEKPAELTAIKEKIEEVTKQVSALKDGLDK